MRTQRERAPRVGTGSAWGWRGVALAIVVGLAVVGCAAAVPTATPATDAAGLPVGTQHYPVENIDHVRETVNYPQTPPVGGPHAAAWQNCGFYSQPVPNEPAVHSLEHGAVWITFQPDLPADQMETLRRLAQQPYVLVSPYPGLTSPVVASAWGFQLRLDSANDARLERFIRALANRPDGPEPGAPCTRGTGTPG